MTRSDTVILLMQFRIMRHALQSHMLQQRAMIENRALNQALDMAKTIIMMMIMLLLDMKTCLGMKKIVLE